jgi:DNA-directed RNA polymerase subunit RPC12/RpoP
MVGKIINVLLVVLLLELMSCASAHGQDKEPLVLFGEGFFNQERNDVHIWRWMGDRTPKGETPLPLEGFVNLLNTNQEMTLTIIGDVPLHALPEPPTMKIIFNGATLEEFIPTNRALKKVYKIPASKQSKEEYSELRITTNRVFVSSEFYKKSTDQRRLGFQLTKLTWTGKEGDVQTAEPRNPVRPAPTGPAAGPQKTGSRAWLSAALLIGLGISVALVLALAAGLYVRRRRTAKTPEGAIVKDTKDQSEVAAPVVSFKCSECGKNLKTKAGSAGKKVKCPHCGKAVLAPVPDESSGTAR